MVEIETRSKIPTLLTFWRIQWHVIPEPRATLQGERIPSAILKIFFRRILFIFCFLNVVWASASGGFRIVSDTLVRRLVVVVVVGLKNGVAKLSYTRQRS